MSIELSKEQRRELVASIQRYCAAEMETPLGNLGSEALLDFVLAEVGPLVYNKAVADVQERLQARIMDLDIEIHEDEFQYWRRAERAGQKRRR